MIRRSRISVRPNVRPGNRSATTSQDTSQKNQSFSLQSSVGLELTEPAPEHPLFTEAGKSYTEHPETAASCQIDVSQSREQFSGPQLKEELPSLSLSKPHSAAFTEITHDKTTSAQSPSSNRCTLPSHKRATSVKFSPPRVTINTDETTPSTAFVQAKANSKAPQKPMVRQSSTAVPKQCRSRQREDIHIQQQPNIMSLNKENTEILESNTEEERALKVSSLQPDSLLGMDDSKVSEVEPASSSEQDMTLTSEKVRSKWTNKDSSAMRPQGLNDPADRIRLGKAQKLRELLKLEIYKERSQKSLLEKTKRIQYETLKDHSKMTMRELIYYLPKTNPMKSFQEKDQHSNETILSSPDPSEVSEEIPAQREQHIQSQHHVEEQAHEEDLSESDSNEPLLVPQVKVAEDGSLIIDEESLTVEVLRNKGPNLSEDRDPIFERGSTTTYSSFRKGSYTKPWSSQETDMFFLAISMVGTDFSMIGSMFPHRARSEIKNKFKKEERANAWRIDKAFREKRRLDLDFFTELLEKILADEERRKTNKVKPSMGARVQQKKDKKKRVRKPLKAVSDTEDSTEEDSIGDFTEGEKENEHNVNEHGTSDGKNSRNSREGGDFYPVMDRQATPDTDYNEAATGRLAADENSQSDRRDSEMRHASLVGDLQQRTKPKLPLRASGKAGQNAPIGDCATEESEGASSQLTRRSETSPTSRTRKSNKEGVEVNELPNNPTRLKRTLKRPQPHVPKERSVETKGHTHSHSNDYPPDIASQSKPVAIVRGRRKKRTGLVTIRASASEEDMEVQETDIQEPGILQDCYPTNPEDQNQVPAFVPLGLRSPSLVNVVVEEAIEEDVVDFIAPENIEASEESYKEAAQTLLTIGNPGHVRQMNCAPNSAQEQSTSTHADHRGTDVSSESETPVHGASFTGRNSRPGVEVSTDVSQLAETNSEEPIFIISLTEISPSFIETLPPDTDPPLSHTELLLCNPEPLPSLTETLPSDAKTLPCVTGMLPSNAECLPSFSHMCSSSHEPSTSLTEPHNLEIFPSLKEPPPPITDNPPTVVGPLCCVTKPNPMIAQLNTRLEVQGNGDIIETDRRAVPHLMVTDVLVSVPEEGDKNKQLECNIDISSPNLTLETSDIHPGTTPVLSGLSSRQVSAKCIQGKTPPVSQICKTDQSRCTPSSCVNLRESRVKDIQKQPEGVTVVDLEEIESLYDTTPVMPIAINSSDKLQTAIGVVSHLLIPNALVAVSEGQEGGEQKEDLDNHFSNKEDTNSQCLSPVNSDGKDGLCSFASHHNDTQELSILDPRGPIISHLEVPKDDTGVVSHMIVPDALVPVSAEVEKKHVRKEDNCTKRMKPDSLDTASSTNENVARSPAQLDSDGQIEERSPPKKRKFLGGTRRAKLQVKPALPVRRLSSQNASAEKSALPLPSTGNFLGRCSGSGQTNKTQLPESSYKPPSTASFEDGKESSVVQHTTPPTVTHAMTRPGRKPKGFLSFMSSKNVSGVTATRPTQVKSIQSQRTCIPTATELTTCSSTNTANLTPNRSTCGTERAVPITSSCHTPSLNPEVNSSESRQSGIRHRSEEPTKISEYFLSNIFTEVEERD
ncbi:transcription factor TFIIIB component B'' homolog isoform X2 [Sardina pilchardus]|uniref:transcription factor TFIIIB component B'' homolog isoform X2 n=1 Tax=Sardina pilchardus TaxID=27697 RepID=UPI002E138298